MLILSRKPTENIIIGDNILITVLSSTEKLVRLGITAPRDITIHREEVYNKIKKQNTPTPEATSEQVKNQ